MDCNATIVIKALNNNIEWIPVDLSKNLKIKTCNQINGDKLEFYHSDYSSSQWIRLSRKLMKNDSVAINVTYSGTYIKRMYDFIFLESSIGWYPKYGYRNISYFDLTFDVPDNYKLVSIGDNIETKEENDRLLSKWVTKDKIRNASFNLGPYDIEKYKSNDATPVDLLYITPDKYENVGNDLMLSIEFFTKLFGPLPISKLYATELPASHGEAFPGLLHLSTSAFERGSDEGFWELFVSHEVSHQWWGITVDFESYRDQWLSEGFASYSSLMYLQTIMMNNDKFMRTLIEYRTSLLQTRKTFISDGIEPGPISLGYRTNSNATKGDYSLIIYKKGAWVFHMLRNIFLNINTMNEDVFISFLREIYTDFKLKRISTKLFREKVEKFAGLDFGWFFDQWVDNNYIPKYTIATKTEKTPEGNYKIKCRVKQENVPPSFKMIVPIKLTFDDDKEVRIRTLITGAVCEFELPLMKDQPKVITFNDLESVLCEYDNEDWD
jgi:aminopeptidase N